MPFLACRRQNWSLRTRALERSVGVRWLFPPRGCKHSFGQDTDRWRNHSPPRAQGIGWLLPQPPWRPGFRHVGRSGWTTGKGKGMGGGRALSRRGNGLGRAAALLGEQSPSRRTRRLDCETLSSLRVLTLEDSGSVPGVLTTSTLPPRCHDVSRRAYKAWTTCRAPVCPFFPDRGL